MRSVALALAFAAAAAMTTACSGPAEGPAADAQTPEATPPVAGCVSCHLDDYQAVTQPPHPGARPTTCEVCHTQQGWHPSVLHHPWPLEGAHRETRCFDCHRGSPPKFRGTPKACVGCHRADAARVTFAAHATFGTACGRCHSEVTWKTSSEPAPPSEPSRPAAPTAPEPQAPGPGQGSSTPPPRPPPRPRPAPSPAPTRPPDVVTNPSRR